MQTSWALLRMWLVPQIVFAIAAWALSAAGLLDLRGYALAAIPMTAWLWLEWKRDGFGPGVLRRDFRKLGRRLKKPLPMTVAIIWLLSLIGGFAYGSTYIDSLSYRLPRALHWIAEHRWHWIHSDDVRVNVVGCNLELMWVPLLLIFKADRPLFLVNLTAFLFLPGLFYNLLVTTGVRAKVAWRWMWILPGGYVFALQAASLGSDSYSAVIALAAITLALRARRSGQISDIWFSIFASAFMTGIKQVTLPLGLVWLAAAWPSRRLVFSRPFATGAVVLLALPLSFLPIAIANAHYTGSWKGFNATDLALWEQDSAFWGIVGNLINVPVQNLCPPIFPWAIQWNHAMDRFVAGTAFGRHMKFEMFAYLNRGVSEHTATPGPGLWLLLLAAWLMGMRAKGVSRAAASSGRDWALTGVRWLPFISALVFLSKSSVGFNGRYLTPFYPLMFPALLAGAGASRAVRARWWRGAAVGANFLCIALMALSRQRPLLPVETAARVLLARFPDNAFIPKVRDSFTLLARTRQTAFPQIQAAIPPGATTIGYVAGRFSYLEVPLSFPLGARKVRRIGENDSPAEVRALGIRFALLDPSALFVGTEGFVRPGALEAWLAKHNAKILREFDASLDSQREVWIAYWVEFRPDAASAPGSGDVERLAQ